MFVWSRCGPENLKNSDTEEVFSVGPLGIEFHRILEFEEIRATATCFYVSRRNRTTRVVVSRAVGFASRWSALFRFLRATARNDSATTKCVKDYKQMLVTPPAMSA